LIEILQFAKRKQNDIGSILLEKVERSDLNEDQKEDLLNLVSLYQEIFIEGIERLHQTPLLEFRVELNDYFGKWTSMLYKRGGFSGSQACRWDEFQRHLMISWKKIVST
jgi:hypothetical protein